MAADTITLDHHVYNEFCQAWERRASDPQPFLDVSIKALPRDAQALGLSTLLPITPAVPYPAMADTGCQSCLAGTKLLHKLGLGRQHLAPVTMKMTAANNRGIKIAGALRLRISGTSPSGQTLETRQIVYFTDSSDRLFLSKQACVALGMISDSFPTIGEATPPYSDNAGVASSATLTPPSPASGLTSMCDCPQRQAPPPPPTSLPFPPTEGLSSGCWITTNQAPSTFVNTNHSQ